MARRNRRSPRRRWPSETPRPRRPGPPARRASDRVGAWVAGTRKWTLAVIAAALVAALAGTLAGWLQALPGVLSGAGPGPPTATASPTAAPEAPITLVVTPNLDHCGATWFVPSAPADIDFSDPTPPAPGDSAMADNSWPGYPAGAGGFPASPMEVYVTVQGRSDVAVVLSGIEIVVSQRQQPPEGTLLDDPCGDPGAYRWLDVDLDRDPPRITRTLDEDMLEFWAEQNEIPPENRVPIRFPYTVSVTAPETFLISANTADCWCDWTAVLHWESAGLSGSVTVDDIGQPFRTVGVDRVARQCTSRGDCREN